MLLMVVKGIKGGICHAIYRHTNANNKCMKDYNKNKELPFLKYWDIIIYMDGECHKSCS